MGHTIDEIQTRLSPAYIKQQTMETIREATVEKVEKMANNAERKVDNLRTSTMETVRENPVPVALIGIGIGWLLLKGGNGHDNDYYDQRPYPGSTDYRYSEPRDMRYDQRGGGSDMLEETRERVSGAAHEAKDWIDEKVQTAQDKVAEITGQAQQKTDETLHTIRERADETAEHTQYAAKNVQRKARRQVFRARRTFWQNMNDNPLVMGVVAVAAGALVGLALPGTDVEDQLLGQTRDRIVDEAKITAQQTALKVQTVAEHAQQAAVEEAKREAENQDLTTSKSSDGSPKEEQRVPVR
jgi:ElaB/YqjD/DUF883 family membrane-anchored ribosome-binding protein